MPGVVLIDALTPKTFLSGQIPDENTPIGRSASLLHRIGKSGIILIPDFSTVQSMKAEDRASVLASLRKIFDGKFSKEFGTAEKVELWEGRITVVVGTTPEIDRQRAATQALGERFVMVRWPRAGVDAALRAVVQDRTKIHTEMRRAVQALLTDLAPTSVGLPDARKEQIVALAETAVRGRTHVHRDPYSKEIEEEPQPESPTRLAQQLCQLAKGSARLERRKQVSEIDFQVAKRVAFDCIPPRRLQTLLAIAEDRAVRNTSTSHYDCKDLEALGLLEGNNKLSHEASKLFDCIKGSDQAFTNPPPIAKPEIEGQVHKVVGGTSRESSNGEPTQ